MQPLAANTIYEGDAAELAFRVCDESVALSLWSPPYCVNKSYETGLSISDWEGMLQRVVAAHGRLLVPGGFLVVNIADILCFPDPTIPRFQAEVKGGNRLPITRADVERAKAANPHLDRYGLAELLGVSEQTVDRRLKDNNIRGGKYKPTTRVRLSGPALVRFASEAGLYLYDRRIWHKDPTWENSRWHSNSLRAVGEYEDLYVFCRPGITRVDRSRLSPTEWRDWGSRAVWHIRSVRRNDDHEAKFPPELPRRFVRMMTDPGDTVLDCFVGSGTTAVVAAELGRNWIGIDSDPATVKLARLNLESTRVTVSVSGPVPRDRI
jgi:site-specific DNA-methyltransferase (adenine-specific)